MRGRQKQMTKFGVENEKNSGLFFSPKLHENRRTGSCCLSRVVLFKVKIILVVLQCEARSSSCKPGHP